MTASDPRAFARFQETASRGVGRAVLFFFLGGAVAATGITLYPSIPSEWVLADLLALVGLGLMGVGLSLLIQHLVNRVRDTRDVARALRPPDAAAQILSSSSGGEIVGRVLRPPSVGRVTGGMFALSLALAVLLSIGVAVGAIDLVIQPSHRSEPAALFLVLFAAFVPVFLLFADVQQPIPGLWSETPSPVVYLTERGVEGPFYPFSAYQPEGGAVVIRSPWFKFVRVRIPAPNQIPWKLLIVTAPRTRGGPTQNTSFLSLNRAQLPIGMGGWQLSEGFLPSGGSGDPSLGFGMVVTIRRDESVRVLWAASQAGSRLVTEFEQLTPTGKQALKSAGLEGNSRLSRPFSGPWFVWLPSPGSESELAGWML
ncbi:MAG: hypothetical protein L3K18_05930 [Thermoplasmata archaeon]|nr:hypothetical protein [Thermoplasmata archaeon]